MDPTALGTLIDQHAAALVLYARQWCACPDDVVQAALLKLVRLRKPPENPAAWLFRTVRNAAIDESRSARSRKRHEEKAAERAPQWFQPPDDPSGLDAQTAADALAKLPLEQREVIVARLWGGLSFEAIGEAVGSSAATCHRRFTEGLAALRASLGVKETG